MRNKVYNYAHYFTINSTRMYVLMSYFKCFISRVFFFVDFFAVVRFEHCCFDILDIENTPFFKKERL